MRCFLQIVTVHTFYSKTNASHEIPCHEIHHPDTLYSQTHHLETLHPEIPHPAHKILPLKERKKFMNTIVSNETKILKCLVIVFGIKNYQYFMNLDNNNIN